MNLKKMILAFIVFFIIIIFLLILIMLNLSNKSEVENINIKENKDTYITNEVNKKSSVENYKYNQNLEEIDKIKYIRYLIKDIFRLEKNMIKQFFIDIREYEFFKEKLSYDEILEKANEKDYEVVGSIRIPNIEIEYPVFKELSKETLELAPAILYGPGLNQVGNTVILGHNYRDNSLFSNIDELVEGDLIYITDQDNNEIEYEIYNKYETEPEDAEYMLRDTENKREISLSTSTDDSAQRIIILARETE